MIATDVPQFEQPRLSLKKASTEAYRAMIALDDAIELDPRLGELVRLRASILNGCAYCVDMHSKDARAAGESEMKLHAVAVWPEAPFFDERERAALALTEQLTRMTSHEARDRSRHEAEARFDEDELAALIFVIATINAWNVIGVGGRMQAGDYQPEGAATA
jgi:AhpD family alkylhydroperoxidase